MRTDKSCLIVGAGMAGLSAAETLRANGWKVTLLDKGRGVGGRLATRRIGESRLDHGAQFITVRDPRFRHAMDIWTSAGLIESWFVENEHVRYRIVGGMNALAKNLAAQCDVWSNTHVDRVEPSPLGWSVSTHGGESFHAAALIVTAPAPQALALLPDQHSLSGIRETLRLVEFDPCYALLVTLAGPSHVPAPGYTRPLTGPFEWIADNTQKGIATGGAALTFHTHAHFSRKHLEDPQDAVAKLLFDAAKPWFASPVADWQLHRWRYSKPITPDLPICLFANEPAPIAVAGDAFGGGRVEGAFLSGLAAAERILAA